MRTSTACPAIAALGAVEEQGGPVDKLIHPCTFARAQVGELRHLLSCRLADHALQALHDGPYGRAKAGDFLREARLPVGCPTQLCIGERLGLDLLGDQVFVSLAESAQVELLEFNERINLSLIPHVCAHWLEVCWISGQEGRRVR